jgi:hypothetical protein
MGIAVLAGYATSGAFATRYTSMVFPLVLLMAAYGTRAFASTRVLTGVLVVLALLGFASGIRNMGGERTEAGHIASYITAQGNPGDVVAFCPDQLGPAVTRKLPAGFDAVRFPDFGNPRLVNWVDYAERQRSITPKEFAKRLDERAAGKTLWFVWSGGYRTVGSKCPTIAAQLALLRPGGRPVLAPGPQYERATLSQYAPG